MVTVDAITCSLHLQVELKHYIVASDGSPRAHCWQQQNTLQNVLIAFTLFVSYVNENSKKEMECVHSVIQQSKGLPFPG